MSVGLMWMMLVPVIGAAAFFWFMKRSDSSTPWYAGPIAFVPGAIIVAIAFAASYGGQVADTEVWSGQVTSKERKHGSYEKPYDCNCYTTPRVCTGSGKNQSCSGGDRKCSTCYESHYTVHWNCNTTVGAFTIDSLDRTSRSVYNSPDPARWTSIQIGDPASRTNTYTNYVQAVPGSLFATVKGSLLSQYANMLPKYPDDVFDFYRINRFVTVGFNFTDAAQWNQDISMMLRTLGPQKQVNVIVVVAKTQDPDYTYALQQHWEGANKNDVVLVIGSMDGQKIEWVRTISWTKEEIFKIQLNDRILEQGIIDRTKILPAVADQIGKNFVRRRMREFEYLAGEIDPPTWLMYTVIGVLAAGYAGATWFFMNNGQFPMRRRRRF